ncbi:hypothetical protein [Streptomyces sp. NPDC003023]
MGNIVCPWCNPARPEAADGGPADACRGLASDAALAAGSRTADS